MKMQSALTRHKNFHALSRYNDDVDDDDDDDEI